MQQSILIVEDDAALAEALGDILELADYRALHAADAAQALALMDEEPPALVLTDVNMPGMDGHALLRRLKANRPELPVLLMTAYATVERAVQAIREGAADYLTKPFEADELLERIERHLPRAEALEGEPVAEDPASRQLLALASRVADSEATVLIGGESGVGKEVLARYIHRHSPRADGPFVAINCAAIPESMLEATLFGHEKGAFTGAHKAQAGKFEQAQGGTLLLDEISEMALELQAKLLRVLQEREVERIGGDRLIDLDVRVLATSNRDMAAEVAAGRFREDLFYRLNVFPLRIPPLRERPGDIVPLAERSLARAAASAGRPAPRIGEEAAARLRDYRWAGNVRELDNLMQRALILCDGEQIAATDLYFEAWAPMSAALTAPVTAEPVAPPATTPPVAEEEGLGEGLKARERDLILDALKLGSRKAAAERLGISPRTLRYKMARLREAGVALPM